MESEGANSQSPVWRRWLPWVGAVLLLSYVFLTTDLEGFFRGIQDANLLAFAAVTFGLYPLIFLIDSLAIWRLFNWFAHRISYAEIRPLVGANYLLTMVNYNAGSAGMSAYLWRTRGVKLFQTLGSVLWMNVLDVVIIAAIIFCGADLLTEPLGESGANSARLASGGILLAFVGSLLYWHRGFDFLILGSLRNRSIFHAFREAKPVHYRDMLLLRSSQVAVYVLFDKLTLLAFGIDVPLLELLVYVPIQMLIAALPITVAGIGTVQVSQRILYGAFASLGRIDAYAVSLVVSFILPRTLIGMYYLRRAAHALAKGNQTEEHPEPHPTREG